MQSIVIFSYPSVLTFVLGAKNNRLIDMIAFKYPHYIFWLRKRKTIFKYAQVRNTHMRVYAV